MASPVVAQQLAVQMLVQALARVRETLHQPWILVSATLTTAGGGGSLLGSTGTSGAGGSCTCN